MKKYKKSIINLLTLVLPVMFGVYLGLLANNWNETQKEEKLSKQVLQSIKSELNLNIQEINNSIEYYTLLRDSTGFLNSENKVFKSFSFWKGLNPPLLRNSAYQTGINTGALTNIDIYLLEQLSNTYNIQADLKEQTQMYVHSVTNKIGTSDFDNKKYLEILFNFSYDQVVTEEQLLKELIQSGELIKNILK